MRGFHRTTTMVCSSPIFESTLSGWTKEVSRALNTRTGIFWAPPATDGAFLFLVSAHCCPAVPLWRRTQGSCGRIFGPI